MLCDRVDVMYSIPSPHVSPCGLTLNALTAVLCFAGLQITYLFIHAGYICLHLQQHALQIEGHTTGAGLMPFCIAHDSACHLWSGACNSVKPSIASFIVLYLQWRQCPCVKWPRTFIGAVLFVLAAGLHEGCN